MGCVTSVEARRDMVWVGAEPRARRSFSLPSVDRQRLRSRAVSMLGTLGLAGSARHSGSYKYATLSVEEMMKGVNDRAKDDALPGEVSAKRLAKPRTPTLTPPNEPEVINAWELMAGLEDDAAPAPTPRAVHQSLSFDESLHGCVVAEPPPPQWMQADMDMPPVALDFDPEILSGFREALEDTPPSQPTVISSAEDETPRQHKCLDKPMSPATGDMPELSGIVRTRINAFQEKIERRRSKGCDNKVSPLWPPGGERKAVVYFTSLRGVRKTFVDCCAVRSILRSYGVRVDERDVSMHAVFKAELAELLGQGFAGATLPRVFVDGQYIGGTEDVQYLHEAGELGSALGGCEAAPQRKLGYMEACAACGDVRFVPCETCYGSCKIFVENDDAGDRYHDVGEFRRCPDCNENGLVRCPVCCC
ncbi:uncharacterized protein At3g28850-like [Panicum virgatum]|uniref:Glutaredoxin domain-containing protein n=1 Tax=Panicum virgatum TaxID=38727 RepID=A0A8T0QPX7_PANVG|nr:uncharacterized protein At3g28850-like [Panicum virgatum]KAG2575133.1 hypothetical protein PVAP13_7KG411600 [Panicum virgatum]